MKARHDKGCSAYLHLAYQNYLFPSPRLKNGQDDVPFRRFSHHANWHWSQVNPWLRCAIPENNGEPSRLGLTAVLQADRAVSDSQLVRPVPKTKTSCAVVFSGRRPCTPSVSLPWPTHRRSVTQCNYLCSFLQNLALRAIATTPTAPAAGLARAGVCTTLAFA